jgi:hypothetical protein
MNTTFFLQRLLTIAQYRHSRILLKKERRYYQRYVMKLSYHIEHLYGKNITEAIQYVEEFESRQGSRVKNGFFTKPRKALSLACADVKDVLESMKRWDGIEG